MKCMIIPAMFALLLFTCVISTFASPQQEKKETLVYNESKHGDFGPAKPNAKPAVRINKLGTHVIKGHGIDAKDDCDAFVFEVTAGKVFDFCLVGDAAEFKWLKSVGKDGKVKDIAFASLNLSFRKPRNIEATGLPPGKYYVQMYFGPDGASGDWVVRIAPRNTDTPTKNLCPESLALATVTKMKHVDWPGVISIFHGHNWGKDDKYPIAIKEAGFGAAGAAEWQIDECRKHGLRAFVFIWPHEAATIPKKHKNDKTVLCYYLSDRIHPNKWGVWAALENTAYASDPKHPAIFTMNAGWGGFGQFCPIVRGRAMEYYHYHWDAGRQPHLRYHVLEQFRQASQKNGHVPICRIVETRAEDMRKTRQTIFTSLAYGVRAFRTGGRGLFDTNKRDKRGVPTRTKYGEEFKKINAALRAYSPVFKTARCEAVYHTNPLPPGCVAAPKDSWVKIGGKEVLVGVFRGKKKGPRYLLVANRDAFGSHTAELTIAGKGERVWRMDRRRGKWVDVAVKAVENSTDVRIELEDGGGELIRVSNTRNSCGS